MSRRIFSAVTVVVLAAVLVALNFERFVRVQLPCEEPITYRLGTFDEKFGISKNYFLEAITEAEAIWEKPMDQEFFAYESDEGELVVNLIYDFRQEVTSTLSGLESAARDDEASYSSLKIKFDGLKSQHAGLKVVYDVRVKNFDEANARYNSHVEAWNASDRTSEQQLSQLESEKEALQREIADIRVLEAELNGVAAEINSLAAELNRLAKVLNLGIETYNTIGASRGETFTGGDYQTSDGEKAIDIFEFSSRDKLVRVLAHELGHALGLDHTNDPESIMYHFNESDTLVLAEGDLAALRAICGAAE